MSISCVIVEDEPLAMSLLKDHVSRNPILKLVGTAKNVELAKQLCLECRPSLIFLDINMPGGIGFELLTFLRGERQEDSIPPQVIVTSAYRDYALKGYEFAVVDFLEKPIFFDRFLVAIERVSERISLWSHMTSFRATEFMPEKGAGGQLINEGVTGSFWEVRSDRSLYRIPVKTITHVTAMDNYVCIYRLNEPRVIARYKLSDALLKLPSDEFKQIHRKTIVRLDQVAQISQTHVHLFSGEKLAIGITYRSNLTWF